jgi:hypothetical protein
MVINFRCQPDWIKDYLETSKGLFWGVPARMFSEEVGIRVSALKKMSPYSEKLQRLWI